MMAKIARVARVAPMNSGKTEWLLKIISGLECIFLIAQKSQKPIGVLDFMNTRNSPRDIKAQVAAIPQDFLRKDVIVYSSILEVRESLGELKSLVIDEVHLASVFNCEDSLIFLILDFPGSVYLAGVYYNAHSYPKYQVFPIWRRLIPYLNALYFSAHKNPCALCGNTERVIYSKYVGKEVRATTDVIGDVGDKYVNICYECGLIERLGPAGYGNLHVFIDDERLDDDAVQWGFELIRENSVGSTKEEQEVERDLMFFLLKKSEEERVKFVRRTKKNETCIPN